MEKGCSMKIADLMAYGTSEGVKKEWDSRGRRGKAPAHADFDGVLKSEDGWTRESKRRKNFWGNQGGLKTVWHKPDPRPGYRKGEQQVRVADNGHWEHVSHSSHVIAEGDGASTLSDHLGKNLDAQTEFSPSMRLRMPKKAGTGQVTQNPQYTGGQPPLQAKRADGHCCDACAKAAEMEAKGFKRPSGGCASRGGAFHKGASYDSKAAKMGHRIPLSAAAVVIRQRPIGRRQRGYSFRGYQTV
jgi:hypothetical protein